jgi:hypothetical protein
MHIAIDDKAKSGPVTAGGRGLNWNRNLYAWLQANVLGRLRSEAFWLQQAACAISVKYFTLRSLRSREIFSDIAIKDR